MVLGDFNAEPKESSHVFFEAHLIRLPKENGYKTLLPFGLHFDHVYVTESMKPRIRDGNSVIVKADLFGDSMRKAMMIYSDHLPVYADVMIDSLP